MIANSKYMMAQNPKAQTGGHFGSSDTETEKKTLPGPITDGNPGRWGYFAYVLLHVASLGTTMAAALIEHVAPKADLTPADYFVEIATWMMVIVNPIAVVLALLSTTLWARECSKSRKGKSPLTFAMYIPQFILGLFFVVFSATLMLNVYVIAQGQADKAAEDSTIGFVPAALYLQCFVLATLLYNPVIALTMHLGK